VYLGAVLITEFAFFDNEDGKQERAEGHLGRKFVCSDTDDLSATVIHCLLGGRSAHLDQPFYSGHPGVAF